MKFLKMGLFYLIGIFGIICISVFPHFFATAGLSNPFEYVKDLGSFFLGLFQTESWMFQAAHSPGDYSLLGTLWEPYVYSMQLFFGAILLGFSLAFILAFAANFLPRKVMQWVKRTLDLLESVPDVVIAVSLQALSIYIYKSSGVDLFRVAGYMDENVYFAPIVTLAIMPMISLFKILLFRIEEEFLKDYVVFLKSKGIHKTGILVRHVLKNVLPTTFQHSKVIIWATLSSQFIIEYLFNTHGVTFFILDSFNSMTIAVTLVLIFTPFFVFFQLVDLYLYEDPLHSQNIMVNNNQPFNPVQSIKNLVNAVSRIRLNDVKPWKPFVYVGGLFFRHMKNYKFAIGSLFFIVVIGVSVIYSTTTNDHVDQVRIIYEADGLTIKSIPPHPPGMPFLLGSDNVGFDYLDRLIIGAKYTLIFGLLIAGLRVLLGLLGGILFAFFLKGKKQGWIERLVDSIHFLPLTVIAYVLLQPILSVRPGMVTYSLTERIILEIIILTAIVIPLTTVLIGNNVKDVLQSEFIMSAKVLGGSKFYILVRHVLPHVGPRVAILFGQQFIQVLLVFIHLGVFSFFFGGTVFRRGSPPMSVTNEWSGLIGAAKNEIGSGNTQIWLILCPLVAFMLSIFAMQFIIKGVKEVQQAKLGGVYKFRRGKKKRNATSSNEIPEHKFTKESFRRVGNGRR
ncbi:ABC transporter permease subunit [Virgibacillus necropolis]|uniref:ABC transporter permease subunit n=1 Tax=Virgibacillus necropolis TaxID=163877 RepID=UPI00384C5C56